MPIRPRGDHYQVDVTFAGNRRQRQAADEVAALRMKADLLEELKAEAEGKAREDVEWTLDTAVKKTFTLVWNDGKSTKFHKKNSNLMLKYFGKTTPLRSIDTDAVDGWITALTEGGNSGATINRKLACLSKVMTVAIERGAIDKKPKLERRQENEGRIRWLTFEEEKALLGYFESWGKLDHRDMVIFLLDTGCRPSEAYKLTAADVSLESGMVHFWETKNKVPRSIPITLRVREILTRRTKNAVRPFPFNDRWLTNQWDRARFIMGLAEDKQFVPYACRHTCASRLIQKGVPLVVVKEWMGHKTISITLRYAHLAPGSLKVGLEALERDIIPASG